MWIQHRSLPPPSSPPRTLLPRCSLHSDPHPPPVPCCLWDGCLPPHLQWLTYTRVGTRHPSPSGPSSFVISPSPPHIGQWTHPFCGTIPSHKSMDSVDLSICGDSSHCGWKQCLKHSWLILGTLFSTLTLPPMEPVSGGWTLLTQRSVSSCPYPGAQG